MDVMMFVLWFAVGFVFGSVPSGLWLVKAIHGIDIREYGSKNIGSTNVFRTVGGKTAALVLLCDAGKGIIAVMIAQSMTGAFNLFNAQGKRHLLYCVACHCAGNPLCFAGQLRGCVLRAVPCVVFRVSAAGVFVCRRCGSVCNYPP